MTKVRLDHLVTAKKLASSRSQAESFIRLGKIIVNGKVITKPGFFVDEDADVSISVDTQYVSRAAYKLESVASLFNLDFKNKTILDVGSSTGGFTDFALKRGAKKSICVEVGTDQLHPTLRGDERIELHENTDIRAIKKGDIDSPDIVVIDVSFISLKQILPHLLSLISKNTQIVAMAKPQFEAGSEYKHKGVIKNERMRRDILQNLELFLKQQFALINKADSAVAGEKGNQERFYLLKALKS